MISPDDLAMMQAEAGLWRGATCVIQRNAPAKDGLGGQTDHWATLATVACFIAPAQGQDNELIEDGRLEQQNRYSIRLPAGQDISIRDRITSGGVTFEVAGVDPPRTIEVMRLCQAIVVVS